MMKFGTGGNPNDFYDKKYKVSEQMPKYLNEMGLDAYEYECSRGVRISDKKAEEIKNQAIKYNISLSVHSPYYISLSTQEEEKKIKSIKYIIDTMIAAKKMGATKIVVHAGSVMNLDREFAVKSACLLLERAYMEAENVGVSDIIICPETMGKINQLGNTKEIVEMCLVNDSFLPTIDFGHLYSRELGRLNSEYEWEKELSFYIEKLGYERMKHFHAHFSKMEYTLNGGEKRHVTFDDEGYGPDFMPVAKVLKKLKLEPVIICESAGTQSFDALKMKEIYNSIDK